MKNSLIFLLLNLSFASATGLEDLTRVYSLPAARVVAYTPDERTLIVGHNDALYFYDPTTGKADTRIFAGHDGVFRELKVSNDGTYFVVVDGRRRQSRDDLDASHAYVFEFPSGKLAFSTARFGRYGDGTAYSAAFTPDNLSLVWSSWFSNDGIKTWNLKTGQLTELKYKRISALALDFTPDGKVLLNGERNHLIGWSDNTTGATIDVQQGIPNENVRDLAVSPDGTRVAVAVGQHVIVRDVASQRVLADLEGHTGLVTGLAWSANSRLLASSAEDATVRLWDTDARRAVKVIDTGKPAYDVALTRTGNALAVASDAGTFVYGTPSGEAVFAPTGTLFMTGLPQGARVQIDSRAPQEGGLSGLRTVVHAGYELPITVEAPGFRAFRTTVKVASGETRTLNIPALAPITGSASFSSTPSGARVVLNGRTVGTTPLTVRDLPPGRHTYELTADGYFEARGELNVRGDETSEVRGELRERPTLTIRSNPPGATVVIGGQARGITPLTLRDLPAGQTRFTLRLKDYLEFAGIALVPSEGPATIEESLTPLIVTPPVKVRPPLAVADSSARDALFLIDNAPALRLSALLRITDLERFGDTQVVGLTRAGKQIRLKVGMQPGEARAHKGDILIPLAALAPLGYNAAVTNGAIQLRFGNDTMSIVQPQERLYSEAFLAARREPWTRALRNGALVDGVPAVRVTDLITLLPGLKLSWDAPGQALRANGQVVARLGQNAKGTTAKIAQAQGRTYVPLPILSAAGVTLSVSRGQTTLTLDGARVTITFDEAALPRISSVKAPTAKAPTTVTTKAVSPAPAPRTTTPAQKPKPATQKLAIAKLDTLDVKNFCRSMIEEQLTYPSTAKYAWLNYPELMKTPNFQQWVWNVNFTAMNAFGANVPLKANCIIRDDGFTTATVTVR